MDCSIAIDSPLHLIPFNRFRLEYQWPSMKLKSLKVLMAQSMGDTARCLRCANEVRDDAVI
jgi:hypothetical protein